MKTVHHNGIALEDPRYLSDVQLARLGVKILNRHSLLMQCVTCGETWTPARNHDGTLAAGYWICPQKCNV